MIASLDGDILEVGADSLVVGINGLGLRVFVPAPLRDKVQAGDRIHLQTQLIVRQDALTLYGFETPESRDLYNLLLGVDGIGPRTALAVLSVLSVDAIRRAVFAEQAEVFSRVPGVGSRTAQKILLHLKGRLGKDEDYLPAARFADSDSEVLGALTALGYSVVEAQAALQSIPRDTPADVETRLRLALQYFST